MILLLTLAFWCGGDQYWPQRGKRNYGCVVQIINSGSSRKVVDSFFVDLWIPYTPQSHVLCCWALWPLWALVYHCQSSQLRDHSCTAKKNTGIKCVCVCVCGLAISRPFDKHISLLWLIGAELLTKFYGHACKLQRNVWRVAMPYL